MCSRGSDAHQAAVFGLGTKQCDEFVSTYDNKALRLFYLTWVEGYETAYEQFNQVSLSNRKLPTASKIAWVFDYCSNNPNEDVATAAYELEMYLIRNGRR